MATFVHLAPETQVPRLVRNGIRKSRATRVRPGGVFAMPVVRSFYVSHQWLRELKSSGVRTIAAVYFRIKDDEPVWVGHYASPLVPLGAAEATALIAAAGSAEGYEVLVPRRIEPADIVRSRTLKQVIGWRHFPGAHGRPPCGCPACNPKGTLKSRRLRERYEAS